MGPACKRVPPQRVGALRRGLAKSLHNSTLRLVQAGESCCLIRADERLLAYGTRPAFAARDLFAESVVLPRALLALLIPVPLAVTLVTERSSGTVVLANTTWDQVQVDVRVGPSIDCAQNDTVGTKTLTRGKRWAVVSDQIVCWRREQVPGDASSGWTDWREAQPAPDAVQEVAL